MKRRSSRFPFILASLLFVTVVAAALYLRQGMVRPHELMSLVSRADTIIVREHPWGPSPVLYESSDRADIEALRDALTVTRPDRFRHCMCNGTPAIFLYAGGKPIGEITNHHAKLIRCNLWKSDAPLVDAEALLTWFDERQMPGPRREYEESLRERRSD